MGSIKRFNVSKLREIYDLKFFFETGTWKGDGLAYASKSSFNKLYSSEIIDAIAIKAESRFKKDERIKIINDSSINALKNYLPQIDGPCMFWLDAHFPGAEEGLNDYNETQDETLKLPLHEELNIIAARKNLYNDVIIIDDLRIYEEGDFKNGNLPPHIKRPSKGLGYFVENLFSNTHKILKSYEDEGYLYLIPKKSNPINSLNSIYFQTVDKIFNKII